MSTREADHTLATPAPTLGGDGEREQTGVVNETPAPNPAAVVRVLVVDDQVPFRLAARAVIDRAPGFCLVGEAGDGAEALLQVAELDPDLVLMDIKMPVLDGIDATTRLVSDGHRAVVFLLSTYDRTDLPDSVTASGAAAYLHKEELSPQVLAELWTHHGSIGRPG